MAAKMSTWAFVLAVPNLQRSTEYFRDVLGFQVLWEDAAEWRLLERDGVRVMLGDCPNDMRPADLGSHSWFGYIDVDDVDGLRSDLMSRGAECSTPIDRPYGMREIVVTTLDGHRVVFGQQRG